LKKKHVDVLIVGGGLAGSLLAWQLSQKKIKTHVVFDPDIAAASHVAAGLINPVTGQRLVLQDNAKNLLDTCKSFYQSLETFFSTPFYFEKTMLRSLRSEREETAWKKRQNNPDYVNYLKASDEPQSIWQQHTAYLDTRGLLACLHDYFKQQAMLSHATMQYDAICMMPTHIQWQNIQAQRIVFCEGWRGQHNPWFQDLPFQPAKGEILDLQTTSRLPEYIINCGQWLLATHDGRLRLGASYDCRHPLTESISLEAKKTLLTALEKMPIKLENMKVIQQEVGIRPNTLDKKPFLGFHSKHHVLGMFNGFGSKGSMLIPYYAKVFIEHIQQQKILPKDVDIQRFLCD